MRGVLRIGRRGPRPATPAAGRPARLAIVIVAAALALGPRAAHAEAPAPADSSLHRFLDTLADSTDRYFGLIAAPLDTAGLDSALVARLEHPWRGPRSRSRTSFGPVYAFNRVDGTLWGGSMTLRHRRERWRVRGDIGYAAGSDTWLGGGEMSSRIFRRRETSWRVTAAGGRRTAPMNRDADEGRLATLRALISGSDRQHYLRRDGFTVGLSGTGIGWRAALDYRDRLESPLGVTTRWNLARRTPVTMENIAAATGRTHELAFDGDLRLPGPPFRFQIAHHVSDRTLGSDFDYRRARVALGGEVTAGGRVSFVPQFAYGRLGGDPVPQAAFYLGGPLSLRSLPRESLAGTGLALARLDVIGVDDLLALARIPHPALFPLHGGVFAATGAVWGDDPLGGPGTPPGGWPERGAWRSEAGVSLLYRPGLPDVEAYLRLNLAWPVGPHGGAARWSLSYTRALDLLRRP